MLAILGWVVYVLVVLYALSGLMFIVRVARAHGSVSYMGLSQWAFALVGIILFALRPWNKLHLLWFMLAGFVLSFTPLGRVVGQAVGVVTLLWGRQRS